MRGYRRAEHLGYASYYLLAIGAGSDLITSGGWADPMTLESLRRLATTLTVQEAEARTVTLRLTSDR